jgi:C-terminal processing protease CtpA/Prc
MTNLDLTSFVPFLAPIYIYIYIYFQNTNTAVPSDYVDSMDAANYVTVDLQKPMGIVFEENDEEYGGIFVQSLKEDSVAAGVLQPGDQLVGVNTSKVSSMAFDDALNTIVESTGPTTKLILFRGNAKQLYGPTGASQAWLDEFIAGASTSSSSSSAASEA